MWYLGWFFGRIVWVKVVKIGGWCKFWCVFDVSERVGFYLVINDWFCWRFSKNDGLIDGSIF